MDSKDSCKRRDPRYIETSKDLSDWVKVRVARRFGDMWDLNGLLWDMTVRAVKVAFPTETLPEEGAKIFYKGLVMLLTFTFRDLSTITAQATIGRVDPIENGVGVVFFFDLLRESDKRQIALICEAYGPRQWYARNDGEKTRKLEGS